MHLFNCFLSEVHCTRKDSNELVIRQLVDDWGSHLAQYHFIRPRVPEGQLQPSTNSASGLVLGKWVQ